MNASFFFVKYLAKISSLLRLSILRRILASHIAEQLKNSRQKRNDEGRGQRESNTKKEKH